AEVHGRLVHILLLSAIGTDQGPRAGVPEGNTNCGLERVRTKLEPQVRALRRDPQLRGALDARPQAWVTVEERDADRRALRPFGPFEERRAIRALRRPRSEPCEAESLAIVDRIHLFSSSGGWPSRKTVGNVRSFAGVKPLAGTSRPAWLQRVRGPR